MKALECRAKALVLHPAGNREPSMVSQQGSEATRGWGSEGLPGKVRAGQKRLTPLAPFETPPISSIFSPIRKTSVYLRHGVSVPTRLPSPLLVSILQAGSVPDLLPSQHLGGDRCCLSLCLVSNLPYFKRFGPNWRRERN